MSGTRRRRASWMRNASRCLKRWMESPHSPSSPPTHSDVVGVANFGQVNTHTSHIHIPPPTQLTGVSS